MKFFNRKIDVLFSIDAWAITSICGPLRDLVPCAQFKKREKHPRRSVTCSEVAGFSLQLY